MVNPVHKVKRLVVAEDGTRHWVEEEIVGWLSTGITDANGREIFEGDKVNFMNEYIGVVSRNRYGEFIFRDDIDNEFSVYMFSAGLEIVDD